MKKQDHLGCRRKKRFQLSARPDFLTRKKLIEKKNKGKDGGNLQGKKISTAKKDECRPDQMRSQSASGGKTKVQKKGGDGIPSAERD